MAGETTLVAPALAAAASQPRELEALTRRASRNAVASVADYGTKMATGLAVTPILVAGLGPIWFGIWEMLSRLGTYAFATDGRPAEALRLVVAQHQATTDDATRRRYVGATLVVWGFMLPLVALAGLILTWLAPELTRAPPASHPAVRLTAVLLVVSVALSTLGSIPESVLRGMNLGYKRVGWQIGLNLANGLLAAGAVLVGLGVAGLAAGYAVHAVLTGICFWLLVRRFVPWFGTERPARPQVRHLFGMGIWLALGDLIAKLTLASDVIILGAVLGPAVVTTYVLTGHAARVAVGLHLVTAGAVMPGMGGLLGRGEVDRASRARADLLRLTWLFVAVVGTTILLWNRSFITLWVGGAHYGGWWLDALIVAIAAQTAFIRVDAYLIDAALRPRQRVLFGALAAALTIAGGILLTRSFGLAGLGAAILAGRAVQSVAYPILVRATLGARGLVRRPGPGALRLAVVSGVLWAGALALGQRILAPSWPLWAAGVALSLVLAAAVAVLAGFDQPARAGLLARLQALARRGSDR